MNTIEYITQILSDNKESLLQMLATGKYNAILKLPENFTDTLESNELASIVTEVFGFKNHSKMTVCYGVRQIGMTSEVEHFQHQIITILKD